MPAKLVPASMTMDGTTKDGKYIVRLHTVPGMPDKNKVNMTFEIQTRKGKMSFGIAILGALTSTDDMDVMVSGAKAMIKVLKEKYDKRNAA